MSSLIIRFRPDPDGDTVGRLWFELKTDQFSGTGFFWSDLSELPKIIEKLGSYPFGSAAEWRWGYDSTEGDDRVLALGVREAGRTGGLQISVELADLYDPAFRLTAKIGADYVLLDKLRAQLQAMHDLRDGEALLLGH